MEGEEAEILFAKHQVRNCFQRTWYSLSVESLRHLLIAEAALEEKPLLLISFLANSKRSEQERAVPDVDDPADVLGL